jgi:sorbitol-6-phosphate 2-dehydrogenase
LASRAIAVKTDVIQRGERDAGLIAATVDAFGGAGTCLSATRACSRRAHWTRWRKKDFEFVTSINYTAFFTCVKYAQRIMRAQFAADASWMGDIIEINSKSGLEGSNKNFAYAGGKIRRHRIVESFALELCAVYIKVNAISPATITMVPCGAIRSEDSSCNTCARARCRVLRPFRSEEFLPQ